VETVSAKPAEVKITVSQASAYPPPSTITADVNPLNAEELAGRLRQLTVSRSNPELQKQLSAPEPAATSSSAQQQEQNQHGVKGGPVVYKSRTVPDTPLILPMLSPSMEPTASSSMGIPLSLQRLPSVIPGMVTAAVQRRRNKSSDESTVLGGGGALSVIAQQSEPGSSAGSGGDLHASVGRRLVLQMTTYTGKADVESSSTKLEGDDQQKS
jgi:hypothetical protein